MARIRTIKPDFWRSEKLSSVSAEACLLAIGLLNIADDDGYFNANPKLIMCDVFPLRELSMSVPLLLIELSRIGYVELMECSRGGTFGRVVNFCKHQVISRKTASKIKDLDLVIIDSITDNGAFIERSMNAPLQLNTGKERKGKERKGKEMESKGVEANNENKSETTTLPEHKKYTPEENRQYAVSIAVKLREMGVNCTGSNPAIMEMTEANVGINAVVDAVRICIARGKDLSAINPSYIKPIAMDLMSGAIQPPEG